MKLGQNNKITFEVNKLKTVSTSIHYQTAIAVNPKEIRYMQGHSPPPKKNPTFWTWL